MTGEFNAWNPGLDSDIPRHLLPLVTLFRSENGFVDYKDAREIAELTGIKLNDLVAFRPDRLVVHTLLVRVTADLSVQDGPSYEELGLNLRGMVNCIYTRYIAPEMGAISRLYDEEKNKVDRFVSTELSKNIYDASNDVEQQTPALSLLDRLLGRKSPEVSVSAVESIELSAIEKWNQLATEENNQLYKACYNALAKTVGIIVGHRGALRVDKALTTKIVSNLVCNTYVASQIDTYVDAGWERAIQAEGYRLLPAQDKPVIMNVKGASASGKSTIRPQQRELAGKLNIPWEDFALISPDYWRKYLLDYDSLGEDYKYGAMLTGTELEIIDKKLDVYMATKASKGLMSHLLIDRFRFDSFTVDIDRAADSKLLSRFGDQVFLFFMITPPTETVERAWLRGIETGRYKAVDDLLYHNVEAFTGMPSLFLSWINSKDRKVHFEFLDNDVPLGELPKTAAFGWNGRMTILDVELMLNINRYRQVDITATQPEQVLNTTVEDIGSYTEFLSRCSKTVKQLDFADQDSLQVYASVRDGKLTWWDVDYLSGKTNVTLTKVLATLGYTGEPCRVSDDSSSHTIDRAKEQQFLVGQFG